MNIVEIARPISELTRRNLLKGAGVAAAGSVVGMTHAQDQNLVAQAINAVALLRLTQSSMADEIYDQLAAWAERTKNQDKLQTQLEQATDKWSNMQRVSKLTGREDFKIWTAFYQKHASTLLNSMQKANASQE